MKRLFVLLAALAAISSIAAPSAFASGSGNLTCTGDMGSAITLPSTVVSSSAVRSRTT
jgi:hypothetical protein